MTGVSWLISPAYTPFRSAFLATLRQLPLGCPPLVRTDSLYSAKGGALKRLATFLFVVAATAGLAQAKDWKPGAVIGMSQTTVTSPMMHLPKIVLHYTVVTDELTLLLDYTYHPSAKPNEPEEPGKNSPPSVALVGTTKVAVEGHHAYVLGISGKEVKMAIKKKTKN